MRKYKESQCEVKNLDPLPKLADSLVSGTKNLLRQAKTEEDLRIGFEKLLELIRTELNLKSTPKYEKSVYSGRPDAVHGKVIIEYKLPMSFSSKRNIDHAYEQLVTYLLNEAKETKLTQLVGVGFDGDQIFFVQYQDKNGKNIDETKFFIRGPYDFNPESARTFLFHLRGLSRLPLTAENLAQKFGPQSVLAPKMVSALANALEHWGNQTHIRTFFNEWKRLFGIVYGEQFTGGHQEEAETLSKLYKVGKETDFQELLFSVHTYFAFLMKLIAAELLTLRETSFGSSLASQLAHISDDELKRQLEDIENGGIYARKGITNFLEGDFFRWYLDAFDSPELTEAIKEIARDLSEFEPATSTLDPVSTRDLLKKLYQYLVPQEVRHRLGEYYTPDWLAELLLNKVGYYGNTLKRFLDPACGSGTFLVLAIQRAIKHGREKEKMPDLEIAKRILANIWGFDLNPLAIIAARTNYLFALGDLVNELERVEIPIYLTDSVLTPTRTTRDLFGEFLEVSTSVGKFQVPAEWVRDGGFLLADAAPLVEEMAKNQYSVDEAIKRFKKEGLVFPTNEQVVKDFYNQILNLEKQNKNGIWARFLKNSFAPMMAGRFDFVVGNPPWIRWDYLSQEYRTATLQLWKDYGLFSLKGFQTRLGGGKKDFSMLFTYASADYYLEDGAKLGFLITQEVFKSKGAGEGFRRSQLGDGKYLKVLKAHDLVSIQPFEGAANKTAAIILRKGEKTEYPVPYILWTKKKGVGKIATDKLLDEVLPLLQKKKYSAKPIGSSVGAWQTQLAESEGSSGVEGKNSYKAILGANPNPYGVFWLEIKQVSSNKNLVIRNLTEEGKLKIQQVEETIEQDLVFPAIRGSDIERWKINPRIFMLVVQDPKTRRGYPEDFIKKDYPRTYSYLLKFKDILLDRPLYKKYHEQVNAPFYSQFNISEETFAHYKVVWKRMTNDLIATVVSQSKTPFGYKTIIPLETTALIATDNESEAHYLCAIINSNPVRDFIKSFSSAGRGFGTPSVMEHVGIPRFDPKNPLHQKISEISKICHQLKPKGQETEIEKLEKENDKLVKDLFQTK
ncbi:MAG TPA: N-6 DNA methylase [Victivallales bacterium]|nr:N-6 DNA methylase [Victivallales bacterium]HRR28006.1 N-6 DNA methylase [Victivallales bacterium]